MRREYARPDPRRSYVIVASLLTACSRFDASAVANDAGDNRASADAGAVDASEGSAEASIGAASAYAAEVRRDLPRSYWRLGESPESVTVRDAVGDLIGSAAGVTFGAKGALIGDDDTAASFDGASSAIVFGDVFDFAGAAAFTLEAWVNPTIVDGAYRCIVGKLDSNTSNQFGYGFMTGGDGLLTRLERFDVNGDHDSVHGAALQTGQWTHLVSTYDGNTLRLYRNGVNVESVATMRTAPDTTKSFMVGDGCGANFAGAIDEVAVFDRALEPERIRAHFAASGRQ